MDKYENLGMIGEGTYGVVVKCRHIETGQVVAIKKFKESDDDEQVRKTAIREIKILKQLRHENIVNLIEVFRRKGKLYLVFEFVEKTVLEELEKNEDGLDPKYVKWLMWQLTRAIKFCHKNNIVHRDIKPENLLISKNGVLKLCDFGFARNASSGSKYTDYVSTRWYRAPELLVGDVSYGKTVDVWAIGCMLAEMWTGLPLFAGESDIDQLYHIIKALGTITPRQKELFRKNPLYVGVNIPVASEHESLDERYSDMDSQALDMMKKMLYAEPLDRHTCSELADHEYFAPDIEEFESRLEEAVRKDKEEGIWKKKTKKSSRLSTSESKKRPNVAKINHNNLTFSCKKASPPSSTESSAVSFCNYIDTSRRTPAALKPFKNDSTKFHFENPKKNYSKSSRSSNSPELPTNDEYSFLPTLRSITPKQLASEPEMEHTIVEKMNIGVEGSNNIIPNQYHRDESSLGLQCSMHPEFEKRLSSTSHGSRKYKFQGTMTHKDPKKKSLKAPYAYSSSRHHSSKKGVSSNTYSSMKSKKPSYAKPSFTYKQGSDVFEPGATVKATAATRRPVY